MNHLNSLRANSTFSFSRSESRQGFALIITISLMAFLVLLLVTVSTFTRIETQVSSYSQKQSVAREHAKMGLEIAIGELQKYAGRDDRVTARADILTPPNLNLTGQGTHWQDFHPYWTGVWNTNFPDDDPVWLVSGNEHTTVSDDFGGPTQFRFPNSHFEPDGDSIDDLEPWITLVDSGSAYVDGEIDGRVRVQRQPILVERYPGLGSQGSPIPGPYAAPYGDLAGHIIGHYAFWVGDEGIKANLARAGERYPFEEFISRQDQDDFSDFQDIVDTWGNFRVFGDFSRGTGYLYMEDDLVRSMSPGRFGFEFLNDPAQFNNYDFFQGFNPRTSDPYSTGTRHFNARVSAWYRLLAPAHAGEDFIVNNGSAYGFSDGELERLYYDTTAHSRSVLATTEPSPNNNRALKTDLRRSSNSGDWGGGANLNWAQTGAESHYNRLDGTQSNNLLKYPLGSVDHSAQYRTFARPVVTHVHFEGVVGPGGYGTGHAIDLQSLEVKLGLWNPYDVDLDFSNLNERIEIRLTHPDSEDEDPERLQLAFGAGLHWLEREEPEDDGVSHYGSWLMEYYEAEDEEPLDLDFYSSPTPFAFEVTDLGSPLISGETVLFSTKGSSDLTRGRDGSPWNLPDGNIVDDFVYEGRAIDDLDFDLQEVFPVIYFPNGREIRVQVVVVNDSDEVVDTLFSENVELYAVGALEDDVGDPDDVRGPDEATPSPAWSAVWENQLADEGWLAYPAFNNFHEGGTLGFSFGADSQTVPTSLSAGLQNLRNIGYQHRGDSSTTGFYGHIIPNVEAWNGNERGYPIVLFENDGGANYRTASFLNNFDDPIDLETARQMVFYHILRNPGPELEGDADFNALNYTQQEWDTWLPLTSPGQLRRGESGPDSRMFDNTFFSGSLLPERPGGGGTADPREVFLVNPRLDLFLTEDGLDSETWDRLEGTLDGNPNRPDASAAQLMLEGGFNVNSTSVKAWAALLNSFANHDLLVYDPYDDSVFRYYDEDPAVGYPNPQSRLHSFFSRFPTAPGASFFGRDDVGGPVRSIWRNGFRELKPLDFRSGALDDPQDLTYSSSFAVASAEGPYRVAAMAMAEYIVERIREYYRQTGDPFAGGNPGSPFLSVSEFVESGILQEAIDRVRWGAPDTPEGLNWYHDGTGWARIPRAAPSYLHQDDILASLGSVLTARSDTFVVRSYGDAHNPVSGEVEARAYLEAVVQRVPTPVVPDTAGNNDINPDPNSIHGRKFEVISFRWLSPDEI